MILQQDVAKIGKRFDVVEVPNGYALNQLIPQKKAQAATPANLKKISARKAKVAESAASAHEDFTAAVAALKDAPHTLTVEANEQGHLFKGVKADDIATSLQAAGHYVTVEHITLAEPIKDCGEYTIALSDGDTQGSVTIVVAAK